MHFIDTAPFLAYNRAMPVSTILYPIEEFHIEHSVICGQAFRWKRDKQGWWSCLLPITGSPPNAPRHQLVRLWQDRGTVYFETLPKQDDLALVRDYFRLDLNLAAITQRFAEADPHIAPMLASFTGLRVLRQDPVECLFSFLCTPASPLHRIRGAITAMCRAYGDPFPGGPVAGVMHYGFPPPHRLADASLPELTKFGLGFRARYIKESARQIMANGGASWLVSLREMSYADAKAALMTLPGVADKIADCVCLFSLDKDEAIPVDTHIKQIAVRHYRTPEIARAELRGAMTKKMYQQIGDLLRERFGPMAGWAQQYLFYGDIYQSGGWKAYTSQIVDPAEPIRPLKK